MNTSDVQVYDYVMDDGRRIQMTYALFGEIEKDRRVTATITVDGVERFHATSHFNLPAGVPLGEWFGYCVTSCLMRHLTEYVMFMIMNNLMTMANGDEVEMMPVDDRHVSELTDERAEWWTEEENQSIIPYLHQKLNPLADKALDEYPQLHKENN